MVTQVKKRQFSVKEYYQMVASGILSEKDRVELIEGDIIEVSPIGKKHAAYVKAQMWK